MAESINFKMKKIYNKNAREKQLLEEAYGAIYERRNPDAGEWGGGLKGVFPGAEEGPNFDEEEEHDEYHPGYGKVEEVDNLTKHILDRVKTLAGDEQFPGSPQDALDITMEEIRDSLQSYSLENIGFTEDEEDNVNWDEKDEVDEVGGGMNAKEFNTLNKTTPL
jgi:hypothetical protein